MRALEMIIEFAGAPVNIEISPDLHVQGEIYLVNMEGNYCFTLCNDENDNWKVLRENDGTFPVIDKHFLKQIVKHLTQQLLYAA